MRKRSSTNKGSTGNVKNIRKSLVRVAIRRGVVERDLGLALNSLSGIHFRVWGSLVMKGGGAHILSCSWYYSYHTPLLKSNCIILWGE